MVGFIDGWDVVQLLGEGAFAQVKLLHNHQTDEACAVKEIKLGESNAELEETIRKEVHIHKLVKHQNIVQCYGSRIEGSGPKRKQFIFLEYCNGGELFDRIEPELGMADNLCQNYFLQLLDGVAYLHSRGIAHRDIKPENILFSESHQLKLSDFGMATLFRYNGQERLLERRCGTLPYIAPEVLIKPKYHAQPADIWSCGMVLLAMLTGELPWDQPTPGEKLFDQWRSKNYGSKVWRNLDTLALSVLNKILNVSPCKRPTIRQIQNYLWCKRKFLELDGGGLFDVGTPSGSFDTNNNNLLTPPIKMTCVGHTEFAFNVGGSVSATQPQDANPIYRTSSTEENDLRAKVGGSVSLVGSTKNGLGAYVPVVDFPAYSQPAAEFHNSNNTQSATQSGVYSQTPYGSKYHKLVRRMTRFWVDHTSHSVQHPADVRIRAILSKLGYSIVANSPGIYTLSTKDCRGGHLCIKLSFIKVADVRLLVDFRLSRGCGLEFKKQFKTIYKHCANLIDKSPILWSTLLPMNTTTLPGIEINGEGEVEKTDTDNASAQKSSSDVKSGEFQSQVVAAN